MRKHVAALIGLIAATCSCDGTVAGGDPGSSPDPTKDGGGGTGPDDTVGGASDAGTKDGGSPEPEGLPFPFTRPAEGAPVPAAELTAITNKYIALLNQTRYFDVVDERVHGWPESDPQGRYWYGSWWTGCGLDKIGGKVTFQHVNVGADNIGIPTSALLEGMCHAQRIWPDAKREKLVRRLVRGFNALVLAMKRSASDAEGVLLARTLYPMPIASSDGGRDVFIAYDTNRPGIDSYTSYVHIPNNPTWGDVWIKNNRSKDDMGHVLRALSTLDDCASVLGTEAQTDIAETRAAYAAWAKRVDADGLAIATLDKNANVVLPPASSTMSRYSLVANAECTAVLSLRLFAGVSPGLDCGSGIHPLEFLAMNTPHNGEIVRSYHEAAVRYALQAKQNNVAKTMMDGLVKRIDDAIGPAEAGSFPAHMTRENFVQLLVESANIGVPLTWREVRWVHQQIDKAFTSYVTNGDPAVYRVFDAATPDGSYVFTPEGEGIDFRFFASLAGTCVARYRNTTTAPLLDCAALKSWTP